MLSKAVSTGRTVEADATASCRDPQPGLQQSPNSPSQTSSSIDSQLFPVVSKIAYTSHDRQFCISERSLAFAPVTVKTLS